MDRAGRVSLFGQALPLKIDDAPAGRVNIAFRPHVVTLAVPSTGLKGTITHLENLGADILVHLRIEGAPEPVVVRESYGTGFPRRIGDPAGLVIDTAALLVFDDGGSRRLTPWPMTEAR